MHLAVLFGIFLGSYLIYMIFVGSALSLCSFASNHPYRFTRGVIGAIAGFLVAWLFNLPYVIEITGASSLCSVVLGEIV
jgi:hypothetical protein